VIQIAIVVAAAIVSGGLIVALRPLLARYALARPNPRSSHRQPTPQGAGIAVIGATVAVTLGVLLATDQGAAAAVAPVLAAATFIAAVGALDDVRTVAVGPRLVLQMLACATVVAALPADLRVIEALPWWLERTLLLLGGVWLMNVVNFMDGIDWMTVAEIVPVTAALAILGLAGALPAHGVVVALALLGAILGFAPFNRPVAQVFLGDVGSLPIGLLLAWLLILLAGSGHLAAAILLPLYYVGDAGVTLARRVVAGERFWEAHRKHFYQMATARGFTVPETVACVFVANVALALLAGLAAWSGSAAAKLVALLAGAAVVAGLLYRFAKGRR
jgi:UDP-N-acetylmuramyl pentapeptide phosphotransferase/UDP-N-acetylglucosamine-1-phosphate transferase